MYSTIYYILVAIRVGRVSDGGVPDPLFMFAPWIHDPWSTILYGFLARLCILLNRSFLAFILKYFHRFFFFCFTFCFLFNFLAFCRPCFVVVVVFAIKTVVTSIQYLLFLTLQGKETQNKVQKNKNKNKRTRESPNTCEKIFNRFLKITSSEKQPSRLGQENPKRQVVPIAPTRKLSHKQNILCMVTHIARGVLINRVRLPTLHVVSWKRKNNISLCPRSCLRIWSRETDSAVPSRVSLLISILRLNLVLTYGIPPEFRGGVHFIFKTATRHRVSPEFIGSRKCVPMAFTAERPPAQGQ